ncbi:hypothetical protein [Ferruginibacter sp. SUN106]|uniref:hypothetical protein n=1 Tax=Ferruginibacter sp. SUN106 TaxID=2978348 RepID=UPI003D3619A5
MTKNIHSVPAVLLSITLILLSANLFAQQPALYKFIEPNISVSYDSNNFQITNRYSNATYETESYDFEYKVDTINRVRISINANHPIPFPPKKTQDSIMLLGLEEIKATENDSFAIVSYDKQVKNINGFSCIGFVGYDKINKQYATVISCYHFSADDYTEIKLLSTNKNNLSADYELLQGFLNSFKAYSKAAIAKEEKLITSKYTVTVSPVKTVIEDFQYRKKTFVGMVKIKGKMEHTIKECQLINDFGKEIFIPAPDGSILIMCNDKKKGTVIKKGALVLLNSFGKTVKVPFTFSYVNTGAR